MYTTNMLNSFRSFSGSFTTKILVVILIASFALWGIGDMLGTAPANHTIATVGSHKILVGDYQRELATESEQVRRQLGANYSEELLRRLNVPAFVLQRMVQESLLKQEAQRIGFIPDDTTVALEIRKTPAFLNNSGVFDKSRFDAALRNQGISEKTFVERLRMQLATARLLDALNVQLPLDQKMLSIAQAAYSQGRNVTLYTLSPDLGDGAVAPETLAEFHKKHADLFTTPEYRKVSFVQFDGEDLAHRPLSEKAVQAYYDAHRDQFRRAQYRGVEQLIYSSEEKAKEAAALAKEGKSFAEIAEATNSTNRKNISLGLVERSAMLENAANAVFSLPSGGISAPVQTPFGWHVFHVTSIEPEGVQPLEDVRADIETELKRTLAETALTDRMNELEDALAGGSTLGEAAQALGMKLEQAGVFNRDGLTPQGAKDSQLPALDKFIDVAFKTDEQTESAVIASGGGVYYVLRVEQVIPETLPPLESIKSKVVDAYRNAEREKKITSSAAMIEKQLAEHKPAKDIIAAYPFVRLTGGTITRESTMMGGHVLPQSLVAQIFAADIGTLTQPVRDRNNQYLVAHVESLAASSVPSSEGLAARKDELQQQMRDEITTQYLRYLETLYPVTINEKLFERLIEDASNAAR